MAESFEEFERFLVPSTERLDHEGLEANAPGAAVIEVCAVSLRWMTPTTPPSRMKTPLQRHPTVRPARSRKASAIFALTQPAPTTTTRPMPLGR